MLFAVETGSAFPPPLTGYAETSKSAAHVRVRAWLYFALTESLISVNKTYINLTQPLIARRFRRKIVSPARRIGSPPSIEFSRRAARQQWGSLEE